LRARPLIANYSSILSSISADRSFQEFARGNRRLLSSVMHSFFSFTARPLPPVPCFPSCDFPFFQHCVVAWDVPSVVPFYRSVSDSKFDFFALFPLAEVLPLYLLYQRELWVYVTELPFVVYTGASIFRYPRLLRFPKDPFCLPLGGGLPRGDATTVEYFAGCVSTKTSFFSESPLSRVHEPHH